MTLKTNSSVGLWLKRSQGSLIELINRVTRQTGHLLELVEKLISSLANLAIILGIFFAYYQVTQSNRIEKKRTAIEAVSQVRSPDFLKALTILKTLNTSKTVEGREPLTDDDEKLQKDAINYVTNVYGHIAILYMNDLADKCIIKNSCYSAIKEVSEFCNTFDCPNENRRNFDAALFLMERETCK